MKSAQKPLEIPLASGYAQQADEYASPAGVRSATNLRLLKRGGLSKRPGARGLAGATSQDSPALPAHNIVNDGGNNFVAKPAFISMVGRSPLLGLDDGQVFALDDVQGSLFQFCGAHATAEPVRMRAGLAYRAVDGSGGFMGPGAVAVNSSGYVLTAAIDGGTGTGAIHTIIESPEGVRVYFQYKSISTAVQVRAHAVGSVLWLVWQTGVNIRAQSFTPGASGTTVGSETTLTTLFDASYHWDTSAYDGTHWFLVHGTSSDDIEINKFSGTTAVATTSFVITTAAAAPCSIWADSTYARVWVGWRDGGGDCAYRVYAAADLASQKGETVIASGVTYGPPLFGPLRRGLQGSSLVESSKGAFYCFGLIEVAGTPRLRATYTGSIFVDTFSDAGPVVTWGILPISKPDSRQRVWCATENGSGNFVASTVALIRWHETVNPPALELSLPAMIAPTATYGPARSKMYFHAVAVGSSTCMAVVPRVLAMVLDVPLMQVAVAEYATSEQSPWRSTARATPSTAVAGCPVEFFASGFGQGRTISTDLPATAGASEIGFLAPPTITSVTASSGSGLAAGTYSYRAIYEWADIYGRRHRSAPSAPVSVTLTDPDNVSIEVTAINVTQRNSAGVRMFPRLVLYRTLSGGTTYQRTVDGLAVSPSGYVSLTDSNSDATIADEEILYTDGGVLDNNIAPSCRYLARSEDRLWFGGLFTPSVVQCSKIIIPEEPIQCTDHPSHQVVLPGECTGLAYMDGQIVAFTHEAILLISSGGGPNDQGQGEFAPPRLHTTGLGCVDGRSVLETPEGIFFLSQRGIELLPRGFGNVTFIGEAIKDLVQTIQLDQCCFAAYQADKNGSYARFGLMTGSSEFSVPSVRYVATFDLATAQWFVDYYGSETMGAMGAWPRGFALVRTDLNSNSSPTPIWYEDGSLVSQPEAAGAAHIDSWIGCQRLFPFGHGGHGNVRRLVLTFVSHATNWQLTISAQTDDNSAQTESWTITTTGLLRREITLAKPRCSMLSVLVSDTDVGGNGAKQAATYLSIAIESDPLEGARGLAEGEKR